MQFVVTAMDFTDSDALTRRLAQRAAHLDGVRTLMARGQFVSGGAILDDTGRMIGSSLHLEFPDRATLEATLNQDPYVIGKVWDKIEIREVRLVAKPIAS